MQAVPSRVKPGRQLQVVVQTQPLEPGMHSPAPSKAQLSPKGNGRIGNYFGRCNSPIIEIERKLESFVLGT